MSEEPTSKAQPSQKGPALPKPEPFAAWRRVLGMPFAWVLCRLVFTVFGRYRVEGKERVPRTGGLLVFPNHRSDCDPPVVHAMSPRAFHYMAKSELFEMRLTAWAMWLMGAFPIRRGEPDRAALRHAAELAKMGEAVCVFPEGQLTQTGHLQAIKPGVALIVRMAGAPCICLGLRNTEAVVPYGAVRPHFTGKRIQGVWGEVRTFDKTATTEEITGWIESELRRLTGDEESRRQLADGGQKDSQPPTLTR